MMKQKKQSPASLVGQPDFQEEIWDSGAAELWGLYCSTTHHRQCSISYTSAFTLQPTKYSSPAG